MIRKLDTYECQYLLKQNYIGYMAYVYNNRPYVLPVTFYYNDKEHVILGYSGEGHKIKALRINNAVSLGVAEIDSVNNWKSISAHGTYKEFEGSSAKINLHKFSEGVKKIIIKREAKHLNHISEFSSKIYNGDFPIVFQIEIEELTGRERKF